MAITTPTFTFYPKGKKNLLSAMNLTTGIASLQMLLVDATYTPDNAHEFVSDLTGEVTTNGGGRVTLTNASITISGTDVMIDCDDIIWIATGGDLTARRFILFSNVNGTDATRELIAHGLLDNADANVVASEGKTLKYIVPGTGLFKAQ